MNCRPINKSNPKNIYCDHCEHYSFKWNHGTCKCEQSKHFTKPRHYWNRCKCFEWKKDGNYVQS